MTTLIVTVEDGKEDDLKKILLEAPFKVEVVSNNFPPQVAEPESTYEKIKKIQEEIGDMNLFKEIEDPSEWQRQIRKEWDRDF